MGLTAQQENFIAFFRKGPGLQPNLRGNIDTIYQTTRGSTLEKLFMT